MGLKCNQQITYETKSLIKPKIKINTRKWKIEDALRLFDYLLPDSTPA